jgi:hypothetical protein
MAKTPQAQDPKYHFDMWKGAEADFVNLDPSIYYAENYNGQCGYAELSTDFSGAVDLIIEEYSRSELGNWVAPLAHMSRQLIELHLKALMEAIASKDSSFDVKPLGGHNLLAIWKPCLDWISANGYRIGEDSRLPMTSRIIEAFNAIDPGGDLFRFGMSRRSAFGKQKSYDRVGLCLPQFKQELDAFRGLISHWEATIFREVLASEMGWKKDPYFDSEYFPKTTIPTIPQAEQDVHGNTH